MPAQPYVARFGWTPRDLLLVPLCLLFVAVDTIMAVTGDLVMGSRGALIPLSTATVLVFTPTGAAQAHYTYPYHGSDLAGLRRPGRGSVCDRGVTPHR